MFDWNQLQAFEREIERQREEYAPKLLAALRTNLGRTLTEFEIQSSTIGLDAEQMNRPPEIEAERVVAYWWEAGYLIDLDMTVEKVNDRLIMIAGLAPGHFDDAHRKEDILFRDVLATIAKHSGGMAGMLAQAALKSKEIQFTRYYA